MSTNHVFSAFSFISLILVSIPFPWHFQAGNTGTCMYMAWVAVSNLAFFVNSIVWDANTVNWSPVWCDITSRIVIAINIAVPATGLCIQRHLYCIISDPVVTTTRAEKRRSMIIDLLIGLGLPIIDVILGMLFSKMRRKVLTVLAVYVVQNRRYDIYEDIGCYPAVINTALSLVLISVGPIAIGLITSIYCSMNIYHFWIKRRSARSILASSTGLFSVSLYLRLMILSGINLLCTTPLAIWNLYISVSLAPLSPYPGFKAVHDNFSQVYQIPASVWQSDLTGRSEMELTRWSCVICALIFFIFFGFADEARKHYTQTWQTVANMVGCSHVSDPSKTYRSATQGPFRLQKLSPISSDGFVLPIFSKGQSSTSDSRSPLGLSSSHNRSSFTMSNISDSETKYDLETTVSQEMETFPITPQSPTSAITRH